MYEIHLEEGEVINFNKTVRIEVEGRIKTVGLVITNFHLEIFEDKNKKLEFKEIFRITKGTSPFPTYELVFKEKISDLKYYYEDEFTKIQTKEGRILVLQEKVPLPFL